MTPCEADLDASWLLPEDLVLAEGWPRRPDVGDGRTTMSQIHAAFDALRGAGWRRHLVATQATQSVGVLPIFAYSSRDDVDTVLLGGIHGREPAGALALAELVPRLRDWAAGHGTVVAPLLNPWGYLHHERYGPAGASVADCEHALGRTDAPACPEAEAIASFFVGPNAGVRLRPGTRVLDLHEDPAYEAIGYAVPSGGCYLYVTGRDAVEHPVTASVRAVMQRLPFGLVHAGTTRFGEAVADGLVVAAEDGSLDELLARHGCSPVLTTEILLRAPEVPPLAARKDAYRQVLEAFLSAR